MEREVSTNLPVFLTFFFNFFPTTTMDWPRTKDSARRLTDTGVRSSSAATTSTGRSGTSIPPSLPPSLPSVLPSVPFSLTLTIPPPSLPPSLPPSF